MKGFVEDIEDLTEENGDYRRVLYTGRHLQLVLRSLAPGEEIGEEVHKDHDQFFRVEKGKGEGWIDGVRTKIKGDDAIVVPAGARHNFLNTHHKPLKLYTLYSPSQSPRRFRCGYEGRSRGIEGTFWRQAHRMTGTCQSRASRLDAES